MPNISDFPSRIAATVTNYVQRGETTKTQGSDGVLSFSMKHFPAPIREGDSLSAAQKAANTVFFGFCTVVLPFTASYAATSLLMHTLNNRRIAREAKEEAQWKETEAYMSSLKPEDVKLSSKEVNKLISQYETRIAHMEIDKGHWKGYLDEYEKDAKKNGMTDTEGYKETTKFFKSQISDLQEAQDKFRSRIEEERKGLKDQDLHDIQDK